MGGALEMSKDFQHKSEQKYNKIPGTKLWQVAYKVLPYHWKTKLKKISQMQSYNLLAHPEILGKKKYDIFLIIHLQI